MSTTLFGRTWRITVGDVEVSSSDTDGALACDFEVTKTLQVTPNTCTLKVRNLSPSTRKQLTTPKVVAVRIEAGYQGNVDQIYLGDARAVMPGEMDGPEIITTLTSGDGEKPLSCSRIGVPVGAKASQASVLNAIARALTSDTVPGATPLGMGNVATIAASLNSTGKAAFPRATVLHGNTARHLTDFCRSAGLEWSVQDGVIQILDLGQPLQNNPYILSADSGLYGSPKLETDGKVSFDCAMLPHLRPGMRVEIDSMFVSGVYRISQATYKGETWGEGTSSPWGMSCVCDKPKGIL